MKIEDYNFPKSSFLSVEKDLSIIVDMILKNKRLKKLLVFDTRDALDRELTIEHDHQVLEQHIKIVPKIYVDTEVKTYLVISFDNFSVGENPEYRDNDVIIDIVCHIDNWRLKDFSLRPYKIAGEIDSMFEKQRLSGIGKLEFIGSTQLDLDNNYMAITLLYRAYHGEEDSINSLNPLDDKKIKEAFDEMYNQ